MRLGGPLFPKPDSPEAWVASVKAHGYRAAFCPVAPDADDATVQAFAEAATAAGIVIAEVGAWSNPISPDPEVAKAALDKCKACLDLADRIGANCAVNITGSRGERWDGPHEDNLTPETFDLVVACVREIVDTVKPSRACYTLETMPWMYPDSPDNYVRLLDAIDRSSVGVHFDPVNLICSPQRYFNNAALIDEFISKLGPHIKSSHLKDTYLHPRLTTHLDEVRPGQGNLDIAAFLRGMERLNPELPVMLEHLPSEEEYKAAADHVRSVAKEMGVTL